MSICVGIGDKARSIKQMYVGVDGKARRISKVYVGVNNVARLAYSLASIKDIPVSTGGVCNWAGYNWTVAHVTTDLIYLILTDIHSMCEFGVTAQYAVSTLAEKCTSFLNTIPASYRSMLADVTVNGVTSKVFVPAHGMVCTDSNAPYSGTNGTNNYNAPRVSGYVKDAYGDGKTAYPCFDLFSATASTRLTTRIAYYNGEATDWWTSTAGHNGTVWYVLSYASAFMTGANTTLERGFRPCIAVKRK